MSCPEDNDSKRLTRFYLYRRIKNLWAISGAPKGSAIVLAGDEASEVGCLRDYLKFEGKDSYFVDLDRTGLDVVQKEWKKAQIFHGPIEDAISSVRDQLALINFDFCGYLNEKAVASIQASSSKISPKGFVAYTFARDRENS